ncbi:MAG: hypothetical protein COV33_00630 [Candidatus Zambryskibacteria bacterium CG10_big_fil_rev_8_21_14_0_10_34_34]|uniref:Uncharacterized protein n=1 Tax=Candidatus Zambryskibacteria bacterium CG10_big_fil_rev_8_21_14_0_10_34_34 TaxID=1975114 RepID=A0A2H0R1A2_9BACT|nr:MAG: hypothetical protein COV33_00630 [Candidatus Zambryskibacteria bacterium CG10_big_fil_rev_8_21_14_0_10_34_34]
MKNNFYISFGVWVTIIPFLGIPGTWRNILVFISGIFLVLVSLGSIIFKKLEIDTKSKPNKKSIKNNPPDMIVSNNE